MPTKIDGTNGVIQAYDYQVLTTGFSYTFASGTQMLVINPAGTLATGTITMPAAPADGMVVTISSTQPITALTVNANTGQTISNGGARGLQSGGSLSYMYNLANTAWRPFNATLPIGVGQTWQDLTASRALSTTYTNSTGRPIQVSVTATSTSSGSIDLQLTVGGVLAGRQYQVPPGGFTAVGTVYAIVPAGNTYSCTGSGAASFTWQELR
jgi:hypothetical protein